MAQRSQNLLWPLTDEERHDWNRYFLALAGATGGKPGVIVPASDVRLWLASVPTSAEHIAIFRQQRNGNGMAVSMSNDPLVVLGWPGPERPTDVRAGLYLVDTRSGSVQRVLPDWLFSLADYSIQGGGLSWSSGGENLVVACAIWAKTEPLITEGRLCLIPVSTGR
jgi:hypothetical protein